MIDLRLSKSLTVKHGKHFSYLSARRNNTANGSRINIIIFLFFWEVSGDCSCFSPINIYTPFAFSLGGGNSELLCRVVYMIKHTLVFKAEVLDRIFRLVEWLVKKKIEYFIFLDDLLQ